MSGNFYLSVYGYDAADSGNGQADDPAMLVAPPLTVTNYVQGIQTLETFSNYAVSGGTIEIVTRRAQSNSGATWGNSTPFSSQTISTNGLSTQTSSPILGNTSQTLSWNSGTLSDTLTSGWFNTTLDQSTSTDNPFGDQTASTDQSEGNPYDTDSSTSTDSFGRSLGDSLSGGQSDTISYTNPDGSISWFGPASVVGTDGSTTKYTYTPLGRMATEIDFAGTGQSTKTTYVYDAAGNVVKQTVQPVDSSGNPKIDPDTGDDGGITDLFVYDAQGRLTQEIDTYIPGSTDPTANKTTTYAYSQSNNENITTVTNPDTSTNVTKTFLDGTNAWRDGPTGRLQRRGRDRLGHNRCRWER